jgi:hypothetical protein
MQRIFYKRHVQIWLTNTSFQLFHDQLFTLNFFLHNLIPNNNTSFSLSLYCGLFILYYYIFCFQFRFQHELESHLIYKIFFYKSRKYNEINETAQW